MRGLQRCVAATVAAAYFFTGTGVVSAQTTASPPPAVNAAAGAQGDTMAAGLIDGEMLAEGRRTGGHVGLGVGVGVLTGLIGTGIGYFVIGPDDLASEALLRSQGRSADYQLGFKTGYERKTKSKKRNAFLAGGVLGTAAWVALLVAGGK